MSSSILLLLLQLRACNQQLLHNVTTAVQHQEVATLQAPSCHDEPYGGEECGGFQVDDYLSYDCTSNDGTTSPSLRKSRMRRSWTSSS
jgi:EREBP-like factor